jgi:thiamine-phosphate pyrophosphorylase
MSDRRFSLPKLYAITDRVLSGLSHAAQVSALCAGGARLIQLREKQLSTEDFCAQARESIRIAREYSAKILINDRVDVALAVKADGVHLGQDDLPVENARQILGKLSIIGFSTHNLEQAKLATALPVDYLAIGPVFPTKTKVNPDPVLGLEGLRKVRNETVPMPLVAIGGINQENVLETLATADSVAVVHALVAESAAIEPLTKAFLRKIEE